MNDMIRRALNESRQALDDLLGKEFTIGQIAKAAELLALRFRHNSQAFSCGNGGSMCDAMHFAQELSGRYRDDRPALPAVSISDPAHITCTANDYGYEFVFSRFLEAHARKGDVLLAISTSGKSPNVLRAASAAKKLGAHVIALTGRPDSALGEIADIDICTPTGQIYADKVQELHIKVIHILIELIENSMFGGKTQ